MKSKEFYRIVYDRVQLRDKLELPCVCKYVMAHLECTEEVERSFGLETREW